MVSLDFIKTIMAGLLHRIQANEISDTDALNVLNQAGVLPTLIDKNGMILTDKHGTVLLG